MHKRVIVHGRTFSADSSYYCQQLDKQLSLLTDDLTKSCGCYKQALFLRRGRWFRFHMIKDIERN